MLRTIARYGLAAIVLNEVRGAVLSAPVIYAMYTSGGSLMAIWLGVCSLTGLALSVVVPVVIWRKVNGH